MNSKFCMQFIQSSKMLSVHRCLTSVFQFVYILKLYYKASVCFLYNMYYIVVYEIKGHLMKLSLLNVKYIAWHINDKLPDSHSVNYTNYNVLLSLNEDKFTILVYMTYFKRGYVCIFWLRISSHKLKAANVFCSTGI